MSNSIPCVVRVADVLRAERRSAERPAHGTVSSDVMLRIRSWMSRTNALTDTMPVEPM